MQKTKAELLLDKIKEHNNAYRAGIPVVSDTEYDAEIEELQKLDPDNEWFKRIEPAPVGEARKVKLPIPMKSLYKVKDMKALQNWIQSLGITEEDMIVVTPKFDGLSLLHNERTGMTYSRGGAENEGQNCTAHYKAIGLQQIQSKLEYTYGEFVFSRHSWETYFHGKASPDTGDKYKSPRNTAAGLLNRDQPSECLKRVDFFRYGTDEKSLEQFQTYVEFYAYLCRTFDQEFLYSVIRVKDFNENILMSLYREWSKHYYIDGLVLYANDLSVWKRVGRQETTGNPNYAIAYKNPNFTATFETTVLGIDWKINKAGALKPVVNIETVDTGDCEMENPTGYNARWIKEHQIAPCARILVTRSGGVIPKILDTIEPATQDETNKMWSKLSVCPHCGSTTVWSQNGVELCCSNKDCCGIKLAKIAFFYATTGAENMGEETIAKIFNAGFKTLREMLDITFEELLEIDSFGEVVANEVLKNNQRIKSGLEVTVLMHASDCFSGIGQVKAKKILSELSEEQQFAFIDGKFASWNSNEELMNKDGFKSSSVTIQSFLLGVLPFYQFVAENGLKMLPMKTTQQPTSNKYDGFAVCFTGIRDQSLEEEIAAGGGKVVSGVSKKTTHLIVADVNSMSSKATKAREFGIPILTIAQFKALD